MRSRSPSRIACVVLFAWALAPELRRIIDWRSSFASVSIVSVLPLVALVGPAYLLLVTRVRAHVDRRLVFAAWLWFGGLLYAYAISIAASNVVAGTYALAGFALPALFALWLATADEPLELVYERIAKTLLGLAVGSSVYAIYQFVALPPWDAAWMQRTGLVSIGVAQPFSFRPYGTLNSPGPFADFLIFAILLTLPRLRGAHVLRFAQVAVCLCALGLTLARADWVALVLALFAYIAMSPGKVRNLGVVAALAVVVVAFVDNAPALLGSTRAGLDLQARFATLANVGTDTSYMVRERYFGEALSDAVDTPTGEGLGMLGTAAKLGAAGATVDFDNGYIARFTEMGYFGTACYLATLVFALALAVRRQRTFAMHGMRLEAGMAAACVAVQVALLFLDTSSDHHTQLGGLFFWISLAIVFGRRVPDMGPPRRGERFVAASA
jgi:hypothetical protein